MGGWLVDTVTNITFFITKIRGHSIGRGTDLPVYLVENHGLVALNRNHNTGKIYRDNLCSFGPWRSTMAVTQKKLERDAKHTTRDIVKSVLTKNGFWCTA